VPSNSLTPAFLRFKARLTHDKIKNRMTPEKNIFRSFHFNRTEPHVPQELLLLMVSGTEVIELDEKLFFHIKFHFRSLIFYESPTRFAIRVGPEPGAIAEFVFDNERFYLKPPRLVEN